MADEAAKATRTAEGPRTRGASLVTLRTYLEDRHGEGTYQRLRQLVLEGGVALAARLDPLRWYPTSLYVVALDAAARIDGRPGFHQRYGRVAAEYDLKTLGRYLARINSPEWVLHKSARLWRQYHSTGDWELSYQPGLARGTLRNFGVASAGYCDVMVGWLERAFEMAGARDVSVQHTSCRSTGDEACVFLASWLFEHKPDPPPRRRRAGN
jgi:hypothetical protein